MIKGTAKIEGLVLVDLRYDAPSRTFTGRAAFVDGGGRTHGLSNGTPTWSKETMEALQNLIQSMEKDFAAVHLEGGGSAPAEEEKSAPGLGELFDRSRSQPR